MYTEAHDDEMTPWMVFTLNFNKGKKTVEADIVRSRKLFNLGDGVCKILLIHQHLYYDVYSKINVFA